MVADTIGAKGGFMTILYATLLTYGETHEDDVCVGIGEGPESVVVLLTGGIPQRQLDLKYGIRGSETWDYFSFYRVSKF